MTSLSDSLAGWALELPLGKPRWGGSGGAASTSSTSTSSSSSNGSNGSASPSALGEDETRTRGDDDNGDLASPVPPSRGEAELVLVLAPRPVHSAEKPLTAPRSVDGEPVKVGRSYLRRAASDAVAVFDVGAAGEDVSINGERCAVNVWTRAKVGDVVEIGGARTFVVEAWDPARADAAASPPAPPPPTQPPPTQPHPQQPSTDELTTLKARLEQAELDAKCNAEEAKYLLSQLETLRTEMEAAAECMTCLEVRREVLVLTCCGNTLCVPCRQRWASVHHSRGASAAEMKCPACQAPISPFSASAPLVMAKKMYDTLHKVRAPPPALAQAAMAKSGHAMPGLFGPVPVTLPDDDDDDHDHDHGEGRSRAGDKDDESFVVPLSGPKPKRTRAAATSSLVDLTD